MWIYCNPWEKNLILTHVNISKAFNLEALMQQRVPTPAIPTPKAAPKCAPQPRVLEGLSFETMKKTHVAVEIAGSSQTNGYGSTLGTPVWWLIKLD